MSILRNPYEQYEPLKLISFKNYGYALFSYSPPKIVFNFLVIDTIPKILFTCPEQFV